MPPTMPAYNPPPDFKQLQTERDAQLQRQVALTQNGGGQFEVEQTSDKNSNQNILQAAKLMSSQQQVNNAQLTKGGRRKKKKRKKRTRKYIIVKYRK